MGSGPPILFLHGFPEHGAVWLPIMEALAPHFLACAPDNRGHGLSDCPSGIAEYSVELLVSDVIAIADHIGAARFHLVGHDWGAVIAWFVAARHPGRVERLAIVNGPHPTLFQQQLDQDPRQQAASAYVARLTVTDDPIAPDALWQAALADTEQRGLVSAAERADMLAAWRRPGAMEAMRNWYRAAPFDFSMVGGSGAGRLAAPLRVDVPTLVIWGLADALLRPTLLDGLSALVPQLCVRTVQEAGHDILRQEPALVARLLQDHLETA